MCGKHVSVFVNHAWWFLRNADRVEEGACDLSPFQQPRIRAGFEQGFEIQCHVAEWSNTTRKECQNFLQATGNIAVLTESTSGAALRADENQFGTYDFGELWMRVEIIKYNLTVVPADL